jgi:uncharacterized protein (DUF302 family)
MVTNFINSGILPSSTTSYEEAVANLDDKLKKEGISAMKREVMTTFNRKLVLQILEMN